MLKIHFTSEDVAKVRVLDKPDPLWETVLSLHLMQDRNPDVLFVNWRRRAHERLGRPHRLLTTLAPPSGYTADFLTPGAGFDDLDTAVETMLSTPKKRLMADTRQLAEERPLPSWSSDLASGRPEALRYLGDAVHHYFDEVLQPHWASISSSVHADAVERGRNMVEGGVERLLGRLHPSTRWRSPVLEVDYPVDQELWLDGRGLVLAPSFFCWGRPVTMKDPELPPVLVYPVARSLGWDAQGDTRALDNLLGRTRAAVLSAIGASPRSTTTELAKILGISAAGASQHATVLRESELITTRRQGGSALHSLTPLGTALLFPRTNREVRPPGTRSARAPLSGVATGG